MDEERRSTREGDDRPQKCQDGLPGSSKPRDALHTITINLEHISGKTRQQSQFFTWLPIEIRFRIYTLVMPHHRCLWVRPAASHMDNKRLEHFPSKTDPTWMPSARSRICNGSYNTFFDLVLANEIEPDRDSLALMQTCRDT